jgi:hypothetical protein
MKEEMDMDK